MTFFAFPLPRQRPGNTNFSMGNAGYNPFCFGAHTEPWLKDLKLGERFFVVPQGILSRPFGAIHLLARREAAGVPIGTSRPGNAATAEKSQSSALAAFMPPFPFLILSLKNNREAFGLAVVFP